ncbi:MAG: hypothetical protein PHQ23_06445 [Candidatus Wallbacteria bacterium]|nr:hypothetical protein [Candidatus Wallbacteria bacterium]
MLEKIGDEKGCKLVAEQEGLYGRGFRMIRALEEHKGPEAVLQIFESGGRKSAGGG